METRKTLSECLDYILGHEELLTWLNTEAARRKECSDKMEAEGIEFDLGSFISDPEDPNDWEVMKSHQDQIKALVVKANEAHRDENEFVVLGMTIGFIDGILQGTVFYNPETEVGGLINPP